MSKNLVLNEAENIILYQMKHGDDQNSAVHGYLVRATVIIFNIKVSYAEDLNSF